jgi:hypothetical protein
LAFGFPLLLYLTAYVYAVARSRANRLRTKEFVHWEGQCRIFSIGGISNGAVPEEKTGTDWYLMRGAGHILEASTEGPEMEAKALD